MLHIARLVGKPIVPAITSAQHNWVFNSWDRFMVPKPFSRVIIRFGDPFDISRDLDDEAFDQKRLRIEERMKELHEETDRIWMDPAKIEAVFNKTAAKSSRDHGRLEPQ